MQNLIELKEDEAVVSHRLIAKETDNAVKAISQLIQNYKTDFEEFGRVPFEMEGDESVKEKQKDNPNYRAYRVYFLNENQATLLMTYLKNNKKVRGFKKLLVKEFSKMKKELNSTRTQAMPFNINDTVSILEYSLTLAKKNKEFEDQLLDQDKRIKALELESNKGETRYYGAIRQEGIEKILREVNASQNSWGKPKTGKVSRGFYSEYEDLVLIALRSKNVSYSTISKALGRTFESVKSRKARLERLFLDTQHGSIEEFFINVFRHKEG